MNLFLDTVFRYRGFCGNAAECRLRVYEKPGQATVVVASELDSNQGTSIANMVVNLAGWVWQMLEKPPNGMVWIEHFPRSGGEAANRNVFSPGTFSEVNFTELVLGCSEVFANPVWTALSKEEFDALIH